MELEILDAISYGETISKQKVTINRKKMFTQQV